MGHAWIDMKNNKKIIIIAEACQNHKGDLNILHDMIYAAQDAGADYIKIQSMLADDLTFRPQFEEGIVEGSQIKAIKRPYKPEYQRLKPLDLDDEAHIWFIEECRRAGIKPLTTLFSLSRLDFICSLNWDEIKVASYDCASYPLLKKLKKRFRHLYISTGATYDSELQQSAALLKGHSFSFLHCVTIYPTPLTEIHLKRIDWLRQFTPSVGFSDHSLVERDGLKASLAAIYFGADAIERHFTILKSEQTKDGPISITPAQIKELVEFGQRTKKEQKKYLDEHVPEYSLMLGAVTRELTDLEKLNRDYYRGRFSLKKDDQTIYNWDEG